MSLTVSPRMSRDNVDPSVRVKFVALVTACIVITVLTGAAFWLSYAHLAGVAGEYGLGGSVARQWAWPATLDLFIIAGEVLMFVDSLKGRRGAWAIGLTVAGSAGSIGLNVAGVGTHAPLLAYVVAGVPPLAALLAFGALMHQVRDFIMSLSPAGDAGQRDTGDRDKGQRDVSPAVVPPVVLPVPAAVSPAPVVPAAVSPAPKPVVSRPKASVPAVSPARPAVHAPVSDSVPAVSRPAGDTSPARVDVPEEMLDNLSAIARFLLETGHSRDEAKEIVPTLPGHGDVKPDSLKKALQRAEKALAEDKQ